MRSENVYVYGVIKEPMEREFPFSGLGEEQVYTINHRDLAAVVSDAPPEEIDPRRKNVLAHTIVQERLLEEYDLLPMTFGMVAKEDAVRTLLERNYHGLMRELARLAGKIEVELKVFWDKDAMTKELQERKDLMTLKAKVNAASSPVESQALLVEGGKLVERVAKEWEKYAQRAYRVLSELSLEHTLNKPVGIQNILNASFLIEREREGEFRERLYELDMEYKGKLNFKYVAPLPPYNFVSLKLEV